MFIIMILKMPKLREGILKKECWFTVFALVTVLIMLGAGIMLREFPHKHDARPRHVILRYDDYNLYSNNPEGTSLEEEFLKFALTENMKMSVAPVPFVISDEEMQNNEGLPSKIQLLTEGRRKNLFEICLHGYQHKNNSAKCSPSEFSGVSLQTQKTWIEKGKRKLESLTGTKVKVFVPPFNGWDQKTLMALTDNGFSILSAEAGAFPKTNNVYYFPYTVTPKELEYLLANNYIGDNKLIVVNLHPFDLHEDNNRIGFSKLRKLFKEIKDPNRNMKLLFFEEAVAKKIVFTQEELLNLSKRFDEVRFWDNLPLSGWLIRTTCLSANRPYYLDSILYSLKLLMGLTLFIVGFLVAQIIVEKIKTKMLIYGATAFLGAVMFVIVLKSYEYWRYGELISGKRYSSIFLIFGALVGLISTKFLSERANIVKLKNTNCPNN